MPDSQIVDQIITKYNKDSNALIQILSDIQEKIGYLPRKVLELVSEKLSVPLSKIYGVVTFYSLFRLQKPAKVQIQVCLGTACHVRGATKNAEYLQDRLDLKFGDQTDEVSLDSLACIGACGMAPTIIINGKTSGRQDRKSLARLLRKAGVGKTE